MKKKRILFYTFLLIIYGVLVFYPIKFVLVKLNIMSFSATDNWKFYKSSGKNLLIEKIYSLENSVDNYAINYFPFFNEINSGFYDANIKIDHLFNKNVFVKTNTDNEYLFYNFDGYYYLINSLSEDEMNKRLDNQIKFYNDLSNAVNAKIYVYLPLRYELNTFSKMHNLNSYVKRFENSLNSNIIYKELSFENENEYFKYFYKTDHHYNAYGANKAYCDILSMMNKSCINYNVKEVQTPYYGSMAKNALNKNVSDTLIDIDYKGKINLEKEIDNYKPRIKKETTNSFYDYYIGYFNGQFDEVIINGNGSENLLIISDSLSWQIDYLIANEFNKTYIVNMRYGVWKDNDLDINKYLKDHQITSILFLQETENQIFDVYNHNLKDRVRY